MMLGIDAQDRLPSGGSRFHVSKSMMVSCDLKTRGEVSPIASHGCFKVRQSIVYPVEMHVIEPALMPCSGMVGRLTKRFVERGLCTFSSVHAHVACRQLCQGMCVMRRLLEDVFELL